MKNGSNADSDPTSAAFNGNIAQDAGAGIYLEAGSTLKLSGKPTFGEDEKPNNVIMGGYKELKNGNESVYGENTVRQDIYVSETGDIPASIVISGNLTGEDGSIEEGSIWVWADSEKHYKTMTPFAVIDSSKVRITEDNRETVGEMFKVFRNAQPDNLTENPLSQTPKYLYGVLKSGDNQYIYWYGVEGSARVMLVKVEKSGASYEALPRKTFTVFTDSAMINVAKGRRLDNSGKEEEISRENLQSGTGGAFFIGDLPKGRYYVKEEGVDGKHFEFAVNGNGVISISDFDSQNENAKQQKTLNLINNINNQ